MKVLVVIEFERIIERNFQIRLTISSSENQYIAAQKGELPNNPALESDLQVWRDIYHKLSHKVRAIKPGGIELGGTIGNYRDRCFKKGEQLCESFHHWLQSKNFYPIEKCIYDHLDLKDSIQILLRSHDPFIHHLPWHEWKILNDYRSAEIGFSPLDLSKKIVNLSRELSTGMVNILVVLGCDDNISVSKDVNLLSNLPNAKVTILTQPTRQAFSQALRSEPCQIFFFAGHSRTTEQDNTGLIELNEGDRLELHELKASLRNAIEHGLQLAIFNSCTGLGLASALSDLNIPTTIVMREPVPDPVAQDFLNHFLAHFSQYQPLFYAVRHARQQLEEISDQFPHASWLPVIWQNPTQEPFLWPKPKLKWRQQLWRSLPILLVISLIVSGVVMAGRSLGWLQASELAAYNRLMQSRPIEKPDRRLLIIGVDEGDLKEYGDPIPDGVFAEALEILNQHQPRAIGLDVYRDIPLPPGREKLIHQINSNSNIIAICLLSPSDVENSIAPPESDREEPFSGFVDFYTDEITHPNDPTLRRYLLSKSPNPVENNISKCSTNYSFAILLVDKYLSFFGKEVDKDSNNNWIVDDLTIRPLKQKSGGYSRFDDRGSQTLINYRNIGDSKGIAQQINLRSLLNNPHSFDEDWIKDRIVLIGIVAASKDNHHTPYGKMHGVTVHAHVVSQLLSAIENDRSMISWWPESINLLWIFGWSLLTSIITFLPLNYFVKGFLFFIVTVSIWVISLIFFSMIGLWLISITPLISSYFSIITTIGYLNLRKKNDII